MTTFTKEELRLLTPFDAAAADLMRLEAKQNGSIPPAWLCCSEEAREEAREGVVKLINEKAGLFLPLSRSRVADHCRRALPKDKLELWRRMELELKEEREKGNPAAWFVPV